MANALPPIPQKVEGQSPEQELQQWAQWRQQIDQAGLTEQLGQDPQAARYYNGPSPRPGNPQFDQMYATDMFSPEAGQAYVNAKTHFDVKSGQVTKNKAGWDLPETKLIVALAAGFGGALAAPAIAGALGGNAGLAGAAAPEIASTTGAATGVALPSAGALSAGAGGTAGVSSAVGGASTLSRVGSLLKNHGGDIASAVGSGIGDAATAAGNNRLTKAQLAIMNQGANTQATSAFENELMARAKEEQSQRNDALKQQSYASYTQNRKPGPFNTAGLTAYSPEVQATNKALAEQATKKLANAPQYDTNGMPVLTPNTLDPEEFMKQYGQESTLEKTSNWLSPTLSTLGRVARYF